MEQKIEIQMLNKVELLGRIGQVRIQTVGDKRVANFSVATTASYTSSKGEAIIETTWHNCTLWERWAGQLDGLATGIPAHVTGRIRTRSFTTPSGETRHVTEVVVDDLQLTAKDAPIVPEKR